MGKPAQIDLWGEEHTVFTTAKERYGVWPVTVWDVDYSDPFTRELKQTVGDIGTNRGLERVAQGYLQTRAGAFTEATDDASVYRGKVVASVFNPAVAQWILNLWAPPLPANVYDPFGGGGTRAIMAAASGYEYVGVEIRGDEVEAVYERLEGAGVTATILEADSRLARRHFTAGWADFVYTCPPYYDLEQYGGPEGDLSMADDYDTFLAGIADVVENQAHIQKPGTLAVWVVGLHRNRNGTLLPLHHDIATIHTNTGYHYHEEVVLAQRNNGAIQRVGNFDKGNRRLIRIHEYVQVFRRADR